MHNIEKSISRSGQYVGYAPLSGVWRIMGKTGNWKAICASGRHAGVGIIYARTLREMSAKLSAS